MAVWQCSSCGATKESRCKPKKCPQCGAEGTMVKQETNKEKPVIQEANKGKKGKRTCKKKK